jgi:hypothetical protein
MDNILTRPIIANSIDTSSNLCFTIPTGSYLYFTSAILTGKEVMPRYV